MANQELGTKRVCPVTGRKFYDLNRDPVVSPYTGQSYPRASFEPVNLRAMAKPDAAEEDEEEAEVEGVEKPETISLEDVATEEAGKELPLVDDDIEIDDDADDDDTFLAEEEEDDDDVSELIDGDIETDEEA
ncbi:MAG: TIGR02300 family protein [Beijerinckiaceae bacterium]